MGHILILETSNPVENAKGGQRTFSHSDLGGGGGHMDETPSISPNGGALPLPEWVISPHRYVLFW